MNNLKKLLIAASLLAVLILPNLVSATTVAEIQAQLSAILQQIQKLQQQLAQLQAIGSATTTPPIIITTPTIPTTPPTTGWCHTFNTNLKYGDTGTEVQALQTALEKEGFTISTIEKTGGDFGDSTASAVVGFQNKYKAEILTPLGLTNGTGYVGIATRTKLNFLYGCGGGGTPGGTTITYTTCTPSNYQVPISPTKYTLEDGGYILLSNGLPLESVVGEKYSQTLSVRFYSKNGVESIGCVGKNPYEAEMGINTTFQATSETTGICKIEGTATIEGNYEVRFTLLEKAPSTTYYHSTESILFRQCPRGCVFNEEQKKCVGKVANPQEPAGIIDLDDHLWAVARLSWDSKSPRIEMLALTTFSCVAGGYHTNPGTYYGTINAKETKFFKFTVTKALNGLTIAMGTPLPGDNGDGLGGNYIYPIDLVVKRDVIPSLSNDLGKLEDLYSKKQYTYGGETEAWPASALCDRMSKCADCHPDTKSWYAPGGLIGMNRICMTHVEPGTYYIMAYYAKRGFPADMLPLPADYWPSWPEMPVWKNQAGWNLGVSLVEYVLPNPLGGKCGDGFCDSCMGFSSCPYRETSSSCHQDCDAVVPAGCSLFNRYPSCSLIFNTPAISAGQATIAKWYSNCDADNSLDLVCKKANGTPVYQSTVFSQGAVQVRSENFYPDLPITCTLTAKNPIGNTSQCSATLRAQ